MPIYQKRMLKMLSYQKRMLRLLPRPAVGFERIHRCLLDLPDLLACPIRCARPPTATFIHGGKSKVFTGTPILQKATALRK